MKGMNAATGRPLTGDAHLHQSLTNLLTTPVGTRVLRRDYGSRLPEMVDRPIDPMLVADIRRETAVAIHRWEPRLSIERISVLAAGNGFIEVGLTGTNLENRTAFVSNRIKIP